MSNHKKKKLNKLVGAVPQKKQRRRDNHAALLLLVLLLLGVWGFFVVVWKVVTRVPSPSAPRTPGVAVDILQDQKARLIDGVGVEVDSQINPPLVAVSVDFNHEGYPVSGIEKARTVFELPAEGGVTRLLALFTADTTISEVGPIRSARPYVNDLAAEYDAAYMHVGGSPDALNNLYSREDVLSLDQYFDARYSWRDSLRYAPHNTYTSSALWEKALERKGKEQSSFASWVFSTDRLWRGDKAKSLEVPSTRDSYNAIWHYDDGRYRRQYNGGPYQTRTGGQLKADTIVVMQMRARILDNEGRLDISRSKGGKAWMFRDGRTVEGAWEAPDGRISFSVDSGGTFELKPGITWVHWTTGSNEPIY